MLFFVISGFFFNYYDNEQAGNRKFVRKNFVNSQE